MIESLAVDALGPLDPDSPVARYRQISNQLAALIADERAGVRLPSEFDLVAHLGVSRATATQALRDLEHRGLVYRRQGRGTFVADADRAIRSNRAASLPSFSEDLRAAGRTTRERVIAIENVEAPADVAASLAISAGDAVWRIERIIVGDGEPVVHVLSWLPAALFEPLDATEIENSSLYEQLRTTTGTAGRPSIADEQWSAASAPPDTARLLELSKGTPVMRVVRTAYLSDQTPAEFVVSYVRGETFAVSIHIDSGRDLSRVLSQMAAIGE
jgi:GntR family transcriptional regulator